VSIVISNQLDELVLMQILAQIHMEAPRYGLEPDALIQRLVYGVGTELITSGGHPALDGVCKLVALKQDGQWVPVTKASENPEKAINPGFKRAWRIYDHSQLAQADVLALGEEELEETDSLTLHHPTDPTKKRTLSSDQVLRVEPLLVEILREGKLVYDFPRLTEIRATRQADISNLHPGVRRIVNPHIYHVSLTEKLWNLKNSLHREAKRMKSDPSEK
jgi:nicotinate phosphoribosyltransferase